jgi:hypothetical protein
MKNLIFILIVSVAFASCGTKETAKETTSIEINSVAAPEASLEFADPARMAGSSFGTFFISMIKTQNYDMALKFTSKGSIEKLGVEKIKEKYKDFKYNYKLEQKSISTEGDTITLMYATNEMATGKFKKMVVVVENDSCKLVLPDNLGDLLK